jgi:hypothetical protein
MNPDPCWTTLSAAWTEEVDRYTQALEAAEALPAALREGRDGEPHLQELVRQLNEVARIEQQIAGPKHQWRQAGASAPPELEALRNRLVDVIRALQVHIAWAEKEASLRKRELVPQLDALIRGQQMQRAYGGAHGTRA